MEPAVPLLFLALLSIALTWLHHRKAAPPLAIVNRWVRWVLFSISCAWLTLHWEWSDRPFWVLVSTFFLIWFLIETVYNWMAIQAVSRSPLALFPRFSVNSSGDEWPNLPQALRLRAWLRSRGFRQVEALKGEIGGGLFMRMSVYQDAASQIRAQISFIPQGSGAVTICMAFSSRTVEGTMVITDNLFLPFGGFYPEKWLVERRPWTRGPERLLRRHQARVAALGEGLLEWDADPASDLNQQQRALEMLNIELGFLLPHDQHEIHGRITQEGRYRVWKEIWMLNYFGSIRRYE